MAKVGRPPQDSTQTRQTYRLPATLIARLAEEKARTGVPTSEFIRRAIEAALPKFKVGDRVVAFGNIGTVTGFVGLSNSCFYVSVDDSEIGIQQYHDFELVKVASNEG